MNEYSIVGQKACDKMVAYLADYIFGPIMTYSSCAKGRNSFLFDVLPKPSSLAWTKQDWNHSLDVL